MRMSLFEAARLVSFGLVVLIWLVQLVIYPAFAVIATDRFVAWHAGYTRAITRVVGPLMLAQAALLIGLAARDRRVPVMLALGMVGVAWLATAGIAVPLHGQLQALGHDPALIERLIRTNWIRTASWSLAFLLLLL
jgi:hypothetical protein